ncbi:hypothetical protein Slin15195_G088310 [Septoria linicola]|uniref:Uncharacterized protein n=1 Tax=Septoria linicola TaxID=215465 RepID=A0A9Q9B128_9PEZI|nr:hypothetical protein Slin15195_G088310 [Septoria linicola]
MARYYYDGLATESAAYRAFFRLDMQELPKHVKSFSYDQKGYPIVHFGERHCRMPGKHGFCPYKERGRGELHEHLERVHRSSKIKKANRSNGHPSKIESDAMIVVADEFFKDLMGDLDYEGKDVAIKQESEQETENNVVQGGRKRKELKKRRTGEVFVPLDGNQLKQEEGAEPHTEPEATSSAVPTQAPKGGIDEEAQLELELEELRLQRLDIQIARAQLKLAAIKKENCWLMAQRWAHRQRFGAEGQRVQCDSSKQSIVYAQWMEWDSASREVPERRKPKHWTKFTGDSR